MKQLYLIVFFSFVLTGNVLGKRPSTRTTFDTLAVYDSKILVDFVTYTDSIITEQGQAFLFPDSIEIRRSKWLPSAFKRTVLIDRMLLHGTVISQGHDGNYSIGKYDNGEKIQMTYYDKNRNEISHKAFYGNLRSQWDPEQGTNRYFIHRTQKKKST